MGKKITILPKSIVRNQLHYSLQSDWSSEYCYPPFEQLGSEDDNDEDSQEKKRFDFKFVSSSSSFLVTVTLYYAQL